MAGLFGVAALAVVEWRKLTATPDSLGELDAVGALPPGAGLATPEGATPWIATLALVATALLLFTARWRSGSGKKVYTDGEKKTPVCECHRCASRVQTLQLTVCT